MVLADLLAGTGAGLAICVVGHPFDTLKVLMQTQPAEYRTMMQAGKLTISRYGLTGLYKGVTSPMVGSGLYNAVQFVVFSKMKALLTDNGRIDSLNRIAVAGAVTGGFVALVEGPQDLIKSQMQAQIKSGSATATGNAAKFTTPGGCLKYIVGNYGMRGMMQGLSATIGRNIIGVSAYFYFYEACRKLQAGDKPVSSLSSLQVLLAGGCGGLGYWILCYPFDVIKSAMQTDAIALAERKYKTLPQTAMQLWKEGGLQRYSLGLGPCLVRSFPANAAGFVTYELVKKSLE